MEKNYVMKVLENEEHLNKILEVIALSPATHYHVAFYSGSIEISAFTKTKDDTQQTENLMRCFASSKDRIEMSAMENSNGEFWVTRLIIKL